MKGRKITWIQTILALVFLIGIRTFLAPCGPKEDGTWMHCHEAGQILTYLAAAMLVVAVLLLFLRTKTIRIVAGLLQCVLAIAALLVPGTLVSLCMMPEMRCRAVMRPWSMILAVLILIAAMGGLIASVRSKEKN